MKTKDTVGRIERLKPERVQEGLAVRKTLRRLRTMERLDGLPGWRLTPDARAIAKLRRFDVPEEAAAYAAFAVQLAAGRRQPLALHLAGEQLALTLTGRSHDVTASVLDLAAELG
jgi:hypothetical protein